MLTIGRSDQVIEGETLWAFRASLHPCTRLRVEKVLNDMVACRVLNGPGLSHDDSAWRIGWRQW